MGTELKSENRSVRVMDVKIPANMLRAMFELNPTEIKKLKQWVLARAKKDDQQGPIHLSTYVVTCAFAWVCSLKAERDATELNPNGEMANSQTRFVMNVDCRSRMKTDPPIPGTYFGNCVRPFSVTTERNSLLREDGIVVASQLIGEAIRRLDEELLRGLEDGVSNLLTLESRSASGSGRVLPVASSPRFGLYGVDFGWGKPKKVEFVSNDRTGAMFMKESRKFEGGIEIDLVLNKKEMQAVASIFTHGLRACL